MKEAGQGFARRITPENVEEFKPLLRSVGEPSAEESDTEQPPLALKKQEAAKDPEREAAEKLFEGTPVKVIPPFKPKLKPKPLPAGGKAHGVTTSSGGGTGVSTVQASTKGPLLWRKVLSKTDAQHQIGNITGDLRFTKAAFKVGGSVIDQTKYFRNSAFGAATWNVEKSVPKVEVAKVEFRVSILGVDRGLHTLEVSHKPSGEAGQGNYTTGLRWGSLRPMLQKQDLTGKTVKIHGPPAGASSPFFLTVT